MSSAAMFVITALVLLLPGLHIAIFASVRKTSPTPRPVTLASAIAINAGIGYTAFWAFFLNRQMGYAFSGAVAAFAFASAVNLVWNKKFRSELLHHDYLIPLNLMLLTCALYLSILMLGAQGHAQPNHRFLSHELPPDNIIPRIFSDKLAEGGDPRAILGELHSRDMNSWQSSDRPPLQAGLALVHRGWLALFGWDAHTQYQLLGALAQCLWIPALWAFFRAAGISSRTTVVSLACCIFSGFFLINSVFVWPKLLSAALVFLGMTVIVATHSDYLPSSSTGISRTTGSASGRSLALSASLGALALLAHPGVSFFYPAIAWLALSRRFIGSLRATALFIAVFALWLLPWSAYQKFYDPPGNHLLKWHLAGVPEIDDRSFPRALADSYSHLTFETFVANKTENTAALIGEPTPLQQFVWPSRQEQFFHLVKTLGVLNVGWIALAFAFLRRRSDQSSNETKWSARLLAMATLTVSVWIIMMFLPGSTVVHASSYAMVVAFFLGLSLAVAQLPFWARMLIVGTQLVHFTVVWAMSVADGAQIRLPFAAAAIVFACMIGAELFWVAKRTELSE